MNVKVKGKHAFFRPLRLFLIFFQVFWSDRDRVFEQREVLFGAFAARYQYCDERVPERSAQVIGKVID